MSRPEHLAPPELFYDDTEAGKYTGNSRIQSIQAEMTDRCIELLALPPSTADPDLPRPSMLLDIGCGSGLSGELLTEDGHEWVGVDIAPSMLEVALERDVQGDLFLHDIGQGFGFRPGSFDGAISVSVLQWLCNADAASNSPPRRLASFFNTLIASLTRGARAVFQFYPESDDQVKFIMSFATRAGFGGGLVVDYPNSKKARKFYLVLMAGQAEVQQQHMPQGLGVDSPTGADGETVPYERRREKHARRKGKEEKRRKSVKTKDWLVQKKELYRRRGKEDVPRDSKFTGRKRKARF